MDSSRSNFCYDSRKIETTYIWYKWNPPPYRKRRLQYLQNLRVLSQYSEVGADKNPVRTACDRTAVGAAFTVSKPRREMSMNSFVGAAPTAPASCKHGYFHLYCDEQMMVLRSMWVWSSRGFVGWHMPKASVRSKTRIIHVRLLNSAEGFAALCVVDTTPDNSATVRSCSCK